MHFYTYDEWYANEYYYQDNTEIPRGNTQIIDLYPYDTTKSLYLHIRSVWSDPKFVSTTSQDQVINIQYDPIDCDLGCLYQFKDGNAGIGYSDSTRDGFLKNRGYIQAIDKHWGVTNGPQGTPDFGSEPPYMGLRYIEDPTTGVQEPRVFRKPISQEKFELLTLILREVLYGDNGRITSNKTFYDKFQRILIYQSIYSGAVAFQDMHSRLEFNIVELEDSDKDPYENSVAKVITSLEKNDTWMIAAAMLTFENRTVNTDQGTEIHPYLIIENVSQFVYGHVDMDHQFNWNMLWKNYQPQGNSMPSSIMHFSKTR